MDAFLKVLILFGAVSLAIVDGKSYKISPRIMGGQYSIEKKQTYQVSLRRYNQTALGSTTHFCGGAILNKRWIVTAAYCTSKQVLPDPNEMLIAFGRVSFQAGISIEKMLHIDDIITHPDYTGGNLHDISLVKTSSDIVFSPLAKPAKLSKEFVVAKKPLTVSGWGLTDRMAEAVYSRSAYMKTLSNDECSSMLAWNTDISIDESILCAFDSYGVGLCHGDSGNPLSRHDGLLAGIAIWHHPAGTPCAVGIPEQFTRISHYIDWIQKHVNVPVA